LKTGLLLFIAYKGHHDERFYLMTAQLRQALGTEAFEKVGFL